MAHNELITQLPVQKRICFNFGNNHNESVLQDSYNLAIHNVGEIYSHFYKYKYLFPKKTQNNITDFYDKLDGIAKEIICYTININNENQKENEEVISMNLLEQIETYIIKSAELEEFYFKLIENLMER